MKISKSNIFSFILGAIFFSGVTYAATTSTQTVPTNNKLMKSDITINAIPSSYKNLTTTTTALATDIVLGKAAYNSNGQLIEGTHVEQCINGSYNKTANSDIDILTNFSAKTFYLTVYSNTSQIWTIDYDSSVNSNVRIYDDNNGINNYPSSSINEVWKTDFGRVYTNFNTSNGWYTNAYTVNYTICR